MGHARALDGIFRPRSVAVFGASRNRRGIGHEVVTNLVSGGFTGPVYPINPRAESVHSIRCYAKLDAVPGPVDLAVVVVPKDQVLGVARTCGRSGVKGLVVVSAGFREVGEEGIEREAKLVEIASKHSMRVVGPNCMGVVNTDPEICLNASFAATTPMPGPIAFASQSGALGEAILADARQAGLGIRMFASVGNRADIGAHDLCEYWEKDPAIRLILLYLESFGEPRRFLEVARRLRGKKPIVAVKSGRSVAGARAAGSHTGSVAGEDLVVDTFLSQAGVLRARSLREMFDVARALIHAPRPKGPSVAVVTNAGGPGILATDALEGAGLPLTDLEPATTRKLRAVLSHEASPVNPVDLTAAGDAQGYRKAVAAVVRDPGVDALLVLFVSPVMIDAAAVARAVLAGAEGAGKPVIACVMGRQGGDEAKRLLVAAGVPVFRFPEEAAAALAGLVRTSQLALQPRGRSRHFEVDPAPLRRKILAAQQAGDEWLAPDLVARTLSVYGIPLVPRQTVSSAAEAVEAADSLGFPVVLKAVARKLLHKTDQGGVRVGITDVGEALHAAQDLFSRLGRRHRDLRVEVQSMAPGHRELLLGMKRDPRYGPLIVVGFGGVNVEVLEDVAARVAPIRDLDARAMLDELRGAALLGPWRGAPAVDRALVENCILRLAQLALDLPEIVELDLNPFIVGSTKVASFAVDARVRVGPRP